MCGCDQLPHCLFNVLRLLQASCQALPTYDETGTIRRRNYVLDFINRVPAGGRYALFALISLYLLQFKMAVVRLANTYAIVEITRPSSDVRHSPIVTRTYDSVLDHAGRDVTKVSTKISRVTASCTAVRCMQRDIRPHIVSARCPA